MSHYIWSAIQRFGTQMISFIGNILIARILTPDDFGLIAMLAIFISIAMNFTESGFSDYLIRTPDSNDNDFSTVLVHNIIFATVFYILLYVLAPWISDFYERPELVAITRILGLTIILKAISLSEFTKMRKDLEFKNLAIIQVLSAFVAVIIGYILALNGYGYWALVAQVLTTGIVTFLILIIVNGWFLKLHFDWARYGTMRQFGNKMLTAYFTNQIGTNLYSLFIGKFYNSQILGYYNQAEKINKISFQSINGIVLTTSYALLAKESDRLKRLKMYKQLSSQLFYIHLFLSSLLIGMAEPLLGWVYGNQWLPVAPILQLLLISFLFQPLVNINANIVKIENRPGIYRNLSFFRNGLLLLALLATFKFSIEIIMIGQIIARIVASMVAVYSCGKYIDFFPRMQFKIMFRQLLAPFLSLVSGYLIVVLMSMYDYLLNMTIFMVVYAIVFILTNVFSKNRTFYDFIYRIKTILTRQK